MKVFTCECGKHNNFVATETGLLWCVACNRAYFWVEDSNEGWVRRVGIYNPETGKFELEYPVVT